MAFILEDTLDIIDSAAESSLNAVFHTLLTQNADLFWIAATLSFMFMLWRFLTPGSGILPFEIIEWFVRLFLITFFLMSWEAINRFLWPTFFEAPGIWAGSAYTAMTGEVLTSGNDIFVKLVNHTIVLIMEAFARSHGWAEKVIIAIFAIGGGLCLFWLIYRGMRYVLLAKFTVFIMLVAAPLVAILGLFKPTRQNVLAWFSNLAQAAWLIFFVYLTTGFFVGVFENMGTALDDSTSLAQTAKILTGLGLFALLMASIIDKVYVYAQSLSGVHSMGSFNRGQLRNAASTVRKYAGKYMPQRGGRISEG